MKPKNDVNSLFRRRDYIGPSGGLEEILNGLDRPKDLKSSSEVTSSDKARY